MSEVVVYDNPVGESGESHADFFCDCYYAHPLCYHCGFKPVSCHKTFRTRFLKDSAIYIEGKPFLVLFCTAYDCYERKTALYSIVPKTAYDACDAFVWLSAWYQSQHGSVRAPVPAPPPPPLVVHNPEDDYDYDGFDYEAEPEDAAAQEDAVECGSESAVEGSDESDESADPE
jgi:hypothetical protein